MTDFHAILVNAIAESGAVEAEQRAALYDRARVALEAQMDTLDPPLSDEARQVQRQTLEDAIQRVETELAAAVEADTPHEQQLEQQAPEAEDEPLPIAPAADGRTTALHPDRVPEMPQRRRGGVGLALILLLVLAGAAGATYWRWNDIEPMLSNVSDRMMALTGLQVTDQQGMEQSAAPPQAPDDGSVGAAAPPGGTAGEPEPEAPGPPLAQAPSPTPPAEPMEESPPADPPASSEKDQDRVETEIPAERAFLIVEQDLAEGKDERFAGAARWSLSGSGADTVLTVTVTIPERFGTLTLVMQPNTDPSLPASHTIEFIHRAAGDAQGTITNVPGFMVRVGENDPSQPLRAAGALVVPGQYLLGLSGTPEDRTHNLQLLRTAAWLVIPTLLDSQKRSVFVIEKGETGAAALTGALTAWGDTGGAEN